MHKVIAYDKAGNSTEVNFVVNANHTVSEWMTDKEATIEETGSRHKNVRFAEQFLKKLILKNLCRWNIRLLPVQTVLVTEY